MAGLRDTVDLDVTAALRQIDRIGASLSQVTTQFRTELAGSVGVLNSGGSGAQRQTTSIKQATTATNEQAAATRRLKHEVDGATAATGKYGRTLQAVAQVRVVQGLVGFFGGRALIQGISSAVSAASNLNEEISRSQAVFGDASVQIRQFAETAETSVALARGEALRFANDFGNMFTGAGIARQQAAAMGEEFVRLGADIASFSNISINEALTKLQAGLAGEVEPLRRIGFGFNDLEVTAKAAALGLGDTKDELTEGEKLLARYQVILGKTSNAHDDLARTSGSLANQQRFLSAEWGRMKEELGAALLPTFLELTKTLRDQLPAIQDIATDAVPLLISVLNALVPVLTGVVGALQILSPILTVIGNVLNALPGPVLNAVGAFALLGTGLGPLPNLVRQFATSWTTVASPTFFGSVAAGLRAMNPLVLGLVVAMPLLTTALNRHAKEQAEVEAAVKAATAAFADEGKAVRDTAKEITQANFKPKDVEVLNSIGLDVEKLTALLQQGEGGYERFLKTLSKNPGKLDVDFDTGALKNGQLKGNELADAYQRVASVLQDAAKAQVESLTFTGAISQAQREAAVAANELADGTTNWVGALNDLPGAAGTAAGGLGDLTDAGGETKTAMEALDDSVRKLSDSLDESFGRFLDAEEAQQGVRDAAFDLAKALAEGAEKGETLSRFRERIAGSTRDVARAVEDWVTAEVRAGRIQPGQAQAEIRRQLELIAQEMPQVRSQVDQYLALLNTVPPKVSTTAEFKVPGGSWSALSNWRRAVSGAQTVAPNDWSQSAVNGWNRRGQQAGEALTEGLDAGLSGAADAGATAGRDAAEAAVDEVKTTLRRSASSGLNIGGFLVDGLLLDPAKVAARDLHNFLAGQVMGMRGIVEDAARIDPAEASAILGAVQSADQAARDLAETRAELGANSIEAELAELALGEAQEKVNQLVLDATDATKAYNDQLEKVSDAIDTVTGSLRALISVREAQRGLEEARRNAAEETDDVTRFDQRIGQTRQALAEAQASGDPTAIRRAQATLDDLVRRRVTSVDEQADASDTLLGKELDLIDAQRRLFDVGGQVAAAQGLWEGMFRSLATQAGLSQGAVDGLVSSLNQAVTFAGDARLAVLTGAPQRALPTFGVPSAPLVANASAGSTTIGEQNKVKIEEINIYESGDARATANAVIDEQNAAALAYAG